MTDFQFPIFNLPFSFAAFVPSREIPGCRAKPRRPRSRVNADGSVMSDPAVCDGPSTGTTPTGPTLPMTDFQFPIFNLRGLRSFARDPRLSREAAKTAKSG
jgi:hypothetical protein